MAGSRRKPPPPEVVRGRERRRLPADLEALARGEKAPRRGPRPERLRDPRAVALVPGVANRDARAVHDARVEALRAILDVRSEPGAEEALEEALAESVAVGLWRGKSLTGFDVFAEELVGLPREEARRLATAGAERLGLVPGERLPEPVVATWLRAEAGLLEAGLVGATVRAVGVRGHLRVVVDLPAEKAPEGLDAVGRRVHPLASDRAPRVDRPRRE